MKKIGFVKCKNNFRFSTLLPEPHFSLGLYERLISSYPISMLFMGERMFIYESKTFIVRRQKNYPGWN